MDLRESSETAAELELERFREQWLNEVAKTKKAEGSSRKGENESTAQRRRDAPSLPASAPSVARRKDVIDYSEHSEPRAYHDLEDPEEDLKLGKEGETQHRGPQREPSSALEHYEHAVEREIQGSLGDSIKHYRKAFRLDDGVHEQYKKKHFPPASFAKSKHPDPNPSGAPVTVPNTAHHSLHGSNGALPPSLKQLMESFSSLRIEAAPPPTDASPQERSPLAEIPEEILSQILTSVAMVDLTSLARMAQVCKRLAYLVFTEETIWRRLGMSEELGFKGMHYDFACDIEGFSVKANDEIARYLGSYDDPEEGQDLPPTPDARAVAFSKLAEQLLHSTYASSWRQMFRSRPRIRFNGCYISTVNYARPGASSTNTLSWDAPVHVVTYFRYLRFFRDGTAISLLTTTEPADVVHHLIKDNLHDHHNNTLPSNVMKDALRGRWRLSGPMSSVADPTNGEAETEGDLHIETEGVVPKYTYKLLLVLANAGRGARNNKLAWKGFWSYNRLTDDWGEFGLKNDRAFYWSRVRSYERGD